MFQELDLGGDKMKADIGLIGLAVMGQNLAMNLAEKGFDVVVFNRTVNKVDEFIEGPASSFAISASRSLQEFVSQLKRPRKIILMVKAGVAVDSFIDQLRPLLESGDIIIDGGNSLFTDTTRRCRQLKEEGLLYVGCGISGGEEGARHGPSLMPGGNAEAWPDIKPILQSIAAKADGVPCCDWVGDEGAGHYVKMIHNGIEYGDMQLICEAYQLLRDGLNLDNGQLSDIFTQWNHGPLNSYLIEITGHILSYKDEKTRGYLVDSILDVAGQKGTGRWTAINALELGIPLTLISEAVFARFLSSLKEERVAASQTLHASPSKDKAAFSSDESIEQVRQALYASKIISYTQGFMLMRRAAQEYGWHLNYGSVALMWKGGCIIRSAFLGKIKEAFERNQDLSCLLFDRYFSHELASCQAGWRKTVSHASLSAIPAPCLSAALAFYDGYRSANLPANLLQAQRDYFGAHTYERVDAPKGQFFHTNWTGAGGIVSSTAYNT